MRDHPIPQRCSLAKTLASGLIILAQVISPVVHAETITYQHDNNGNITQRGTTTYIYDALNRLISESGPAKTQSITYDANGNRLSDGTGSYTYAPTSSRMLTRRGLPVTTDATGNITADGTGREYVFNQAGQIAQVNLNGILIASYIYDYRGLRISKVTTASAPQGAQTVLYEYDEQGHLIAEFSGTGAPIRAYVWLDDTPLSQIEYVPSRKIYYFNVDHLNTPRSMMDDTGKIVWRWESDAFGSTLPNEDADGDGVKMASNLRFPGQYYDQETGLHYNWHRYYDPTMGQYIQSDPIGLAGGINTYAYVKGNPLIYVDPEGLKVQLCRRKAEILSGIVDHVWLKTDTVTAGMASTPQCRGGVGNNYEAPYSTKVYVSNHSCENPDSCQDIDNVDEECVNKELSIGKALGRFDLTNNSCQTFAAEVLKKCSKKKKSSFADPLYWR